ncbi:hypothetical protein HNY73_014566 [Argiope bruennichi]|uniref:CUB domain-containing protein n=1 Tax=Argiope bruennichi TaxID=94029 RepID=A0A8T0EQW0_ARGBR|nr:hypothetical protein HNY73_014566 [Argiope bruennichi]
MSAYSITIKVIIVIIVLIECGAFGEGFNGGGRCGTGEWNCYSLEQGLRCIPLNKFCDGIRNCPDGSDEPSECTNCNKTYSGKAGVKYPIRVTGPFQRFLPFVCKVNFVAMGGDFGDFVELSFLSFQIGRFEFTKDLTSACQKGYMRIYEPLPSTNDDPVEYPYFGSFCGRLTERSATFHSKSNNVSLFIVIPSRAFIPSTTFSLFLTYRFLTRYQKQAVSSISGHLSYQYGTAIPGTFCDRMFLNCHLRPCRLRSPNFPGFYPRNITCNYHIKQMQIPHGSVASIVLHQPNDYKIFVPRGGESSPSSTTLNTRGSSSLSTDCADGISDAVRVYDGATTDMSLLAKFCGDGPMPSVISSGPELLVQLYSAPYSFLCSSRLEIEISIKFEPETAPFMQKDRSRCAYIIDANRHRRQGVIISPKYTMPENSSCIYKFIGASSYDRIWLYFVSYLSRTKQRTPNNKDDLDECTFSKLEMFDSHERWPMLDISDTFDSFPLQFCGEINIPRMCLHAADFPPLYSAGRPCKFPEESYLSSGPTFALKHIFLSTLDVVDVFSYSNFVVRYEFVDTRQDGIAIGRTECDRRFDSRSAKGGFISNPKNIFLYGRGGRENLSCAFHFIGLPSERVRITIFNARLAVHSSELHCEAQYDNFTQRHICAISSNNRYGRMAYLRGIEYWDSHSSIIGCICNTTSLDKSRKFVFDSLVNNVKLVFSVNSMNSFEDFNHFNFDAKFEFFNSTLCNTHVFDGRTGLSTQGNLEFHVPQGRTNFSSGEDMLQPLRCRWQIKALTERYLYLQFSGYEVSVDNCKDGILVLIYLETHLIKPTVSACVISELFSNRLPMKEYHVFSQSWYNDSYSIIDNRRDFMFIEIVASSNWKGIKLNFHWMEVTKPFYRSLTGRPLRNVDCIFECPEIGACIDPHLWCDGTNHCPSGFDESAANCHPLAKGMQYLSLIITLAAVVLFASGLIIAWVLIRHRHKNREGSTDTDDRTKDYNHRLTPTDDYPMEHHSS